MGIGALLLDGLGDTIRISLTEDPWDEIDPCRRLIAFVRQREGVGIDPFEEGERGRKLAAPFHPDGDVLFEKGDALLLEGGLLPEGIHPPYILFKPKISLLHEARRLIADLKRRKLDIPVILACNSQDDPTICASAEAGALLCDGLGEGLFLSQELEPLGLGILQAARRRMVKTDYISCPGCGRTLFNLQEVSRSIREATSHLPGVKIAIMGCIVNGPGEMADADFGYVGSKSEKIDLYVGKNCVQRDIDFAFAKDRLIALIKSHGKWVDP